MDLQPHVVALSTRFMANERLRALEEVEKEIATILQCAGEDAMTPYTALMRHVMMSHVKEHRVFEVSQLELAGGHKTEQLAAKETAS